MNAQQTKFSVKNFYNKCEQMLIKLPIYSHFFVGNSIGFATGSCKFFLKPNASLSCTLHQSTLDTD